MKDEAKVGLVVPAAGHGKQSPAEGACTELIDLVSIPNKVTSRNVLRVKQCEDCDESQYWEERAVKAEKLMADFLSMPPAGKDA